MKRGEMRGWRACWGRYGGSSPALCRHHTVPAADAHRLFTQFYAAERAHLERENLFGRMKEAKDAGRQSNTEAIRPPPTPSFTASIS